MRTVLLSTACFLFANGIRAAETELQKAEAAYKSAIEKAEEKLLASFEKNADVIRDSTKKGEEKQKIIAALKTEKAAFEKHGLYPWSAAMRPSLAEHMRMRLAAEKVFAIAIDKMIDEHIKAKEDMRAAALLKLKKDTLAPKVIARWEMTGVSWKGEWVGLLYSNGHYTDPDGKAMWALEKDLIVLRQPEKGFPNDTKVLKWKLKDNGTELDEIGNNGSTSVGRLANVEKKK